MRLTSENTVDCVFELVMIDSSELLKDSVAAGCVSCLFGDVVNGDLFDSGEKDRWPDIIGGKGSALDSLE